MSGLVGKHILLGISGGIAAYKAAELVRGIRQAGAEVQVVMTEAAEAFVTPLTLQALSGHPVHRRLLDADSEASMSHITLARWADLLLLAPASADLLARMANGMANDLLTTIHLATQAPVLVAPAMNQAMWRHPATQANIEALLRREVMVLGPDQGLQACGETGPGRLLEPTEILARLEDLLQDGPLAGRHVLISAGPTREPLDPVRFISNRSSGKMGFALAQALARAGAQVTLVAGPVVLETPDGVQRIDVETAQEMYRAVLCRVDNTDLYIGTAAVADFRPRETAVAKVKKDLVPTELALERTDDILAAVARRPRRPFTVGFAAETHDLELYAQAKLRDKGLDLIAANRVGRPGSGFDSELNALEVYWPGGHTSLASAPKTWLAVQLVQLIAERLNKRTTSRA